MTEALIHVQGQIVPIRVSSPSAGAASAKTPDRGERSLDPGPRRPRPPVLRYQRCTCGESFSATTVEGVWELMDAHWNLVHKPRRVKVVEVETIPGRRRGR